MAKESDPVPVVRVTESVAYGIPSIEVRIGFRDKANREDPNDWISTTYLTPEQEALTDIGATAYVHDWHTRMAGPWEMHCDKHHAEERDLRRILPVISRLNKKVRAAHAAARDDSFGAFVVALVQALKADRVDWRSGHINETVQGFNLREACQERADAFGRKHGLGRRAI